MSDQFPWPHVRQRHPLPPHPKVELVAVTGKVHRRVLRDRWIKTGPINSGGLSRPFTHGPA
ncbi:MAG: hypothetical protein GY737_12715 [Desulfobacteraceae bacterium]|nr:hypothetical protein [Desulfobacteraceae bacterium]